MMGKRGFGLLEAVTDSLYVAVASRPRESFALTWTAPVAPERLPSVAETFKDLPSMLALKPAGAPPTPTAASYTIEPGAIQHYLTAVAMARDAVRAGDLVKAVIARPITVSSDHPIDVHAVLRRLRGEV